MHVRLGESRSGSNGFGSEQPTSRSRVDWIHRILFAKMISFAKITEEGIVRVGTTATSSFSPPFSFCQHDNANLHASAFVWFSVNPRDPVNRSGSGFDQSNTPLMLHTRIFICICHKKCRREMRRDSILQSSDDYYFGLYASKLLLLYLSTHFCNLPP